MHNYRFLCRVVLLGLLAPLAGANEVTLTLRGNNKQITGTIEKLAGNTLFIKTSRARLGLPVSQLSQASCAVVADQLFSRLAPTAPTGFLELADFCLHHKLWARARKSYAKAASIDNSYVTKKLSEQGIQQADQQETRQLYQQGIDHQAAGRILQARQTLESLIQRFPKSNFAASAIKLLPVLKSAQSGAGANKKAPSKPKPGAKKPGAKQKPAVKQKPAAKQSPKKKIPKNPYLRYIQKLLAEIEQHRKTALREEGEGHHHKAIKQYNMALDKIKQIRQVADRLALSKQPEIAEATVHLTKDLPQIKVRFYLALGHIHASVDQLRQATKYVNEILIDEPDHKAALALRERITAERMRRVINIDSQQGGDK